nr:probable disease resistance protein RXW24L isoform X2 [Ziziphus jujuba var. spinosa]XP_048333212.1 probable disease resistance protein RXW24L isoform X2 [Ziziphus jujuba var. spinosa]
MFKNLPVVDDILLETGRVKEEISYYGVAKKKKSETKTNNKICTTMEQSRRQIRCLLDWPIDIGHDYKWVSKSRNVKAAAANLSNVLAGNSALKGAIEERRDWIKLRFVLELLPPFLEEIQGVYLESEIEIAWLDEVEEILIQANHAINNVTLRNKPPHKFNTPAAAAAAAAVLFVANWKAIQKRKKVVKRTAHAFSNLFESKEGYDFRFITRYGSGFSDLLSSSDLLHRTAPRIPSVIQQIHNYLHEMLPMFSELHYKVKLLGDGLEYMSRLLYNDYAAKGGNVSRIIWLNHIRGIAKRADLCLQTLKDNSDIIVTDTYPLETEPGKSISIEIDEILECINLLKVVMKVFNIESLEESSWVVGLEEDVHVLVSQLTTHGSGSGSGHDHSVVSILGVEGIGKTTLAKKIYNHRAVVDNFPLRFWVSLTQDPINPILKQVGEEGNSSELNLDEILREKKHIVVREKVLNTGGSNFIMEEWLIDKVVEILRKKKHILVLDNVSTTQALVTLKLKLKSSDIKNGSRILLTTRNRAVAEQSSSSPHQLQLRTKEESWRIFIQMVRMSQKDEPRAKEMLTSTCAGLPLAILHLGYLMLGNEATIEHLKRVIDYTKTYIQPLLDALKGTTSGDVPGHLINCLSYFKLFPDNFEISARRLVTLWVAEELIQRREDDEETEEEVAEKYLSQLISRNMVQVVERKLSGKVKKCCLPIALQQLWLQNNESLDHRLADHFRGHDPCFGHIHGKEDSAMPRHLQNYKDLVSFFSFDTREGNEPGDDIGNFLRRGIGFHYFHKLLVLDLEGVFRPQLPDSIVKLSKLRYLGLRWTYLETIPSCIGKLVDLETLDVKHTYVRTVPNSIWKLQKLRHLYLNQMYRSEIMRHPSGSSLKNLQTLWGIFVSKDSPVEDGLDKLVNLRKLGLAFHLDESQQVALSKWIVNLDHLQSLRLRSIDEMGEPCQMFLESFLSLKNLSSLELFGRLTNTSVVDNLPHNLTSLTLSASCLIDDPMPVLEKVPTLTLLCLYGNSYTGKRMVCSTGKFPQLLVLRIWKLEQLEELEVNENALQNLRELEIRSCRTLKVPAGLKHLKTLIELKLSGMPPAFAETIENEKNNFWDDIVYAPSITVSN